MISNLLKTKAKIIRINTNNNTMLVWFGGVQIKEYAIAGKEVNTHTISNPTKPGFPSFKQVKNRMREMLPKENDKGVCK